MHELERTRACGTTTVTSDEHASCKARLVVVTPYKEPKLTPTAEIHMKTLKTLGIPLNIPIIGLAKYSTVSPQYPEILDPSLCSQRQRWGDGLQAQLFVK